MSEDYTACWHDRHAPVWGAVVLPLLPDHPRRWLELGSYEGKSAAWTLQKAMRPSDELVCVDGWWNADCEARFDANVGSRVTKVKSLHEPFLLKEIANASLFDVIYVDGDHNAPAVLSDMVLSWKILRTGGVMILDDYKWDGGGTKPRKVAPKHAIDGFIASYITQLRVLHHGYQVILQKLGEPPSSK